MLDRLVHRLQAASLLLLMGVVPMALAQQSPDDANIDTQRFQDWEVHCPSDSGQGNCTMTQLVNHPQSDRPLMRVGLAYPPQVDTAVMAFLLPLGVRLAPGLQLSIDNGEPIPFPYQICQQEGCRADIPVDSALLQRLRSGSTATLSLINPQGKRMDLDISLMGFTAANDRITP
ncbi:invasion associated locus B family protein [Halomonas sp. WWR20]